MSDAMREWARTLRARAEAQQLATPKDRTPDSDDGAPVSDPEASRWSDLLKALRPR